MHGIRVISIISSPITITMINFFLSRFHGTPIPIKNSISMDISSVYQSVITCSLKSYE